MAVVTFGKAVEFDLAALGELLARHFPTFKWQGAAPDGGAAMVVTGRSATDVLLVELRPHASAFAGAAPPHLCHVEIVSPPAGQAAVALRIELVVAGALMLRDEAEAHCQPVPSGNWLGTGDVFRAVSLLEREDDAKLLDGLGIPAAHFAATPSRVRLEGLPLADKAPWERSAALGVDTAGLASLQRTFATLLSRQGGDDLARRCGFATPPPFVDEGVREDRLPTMVLLLNDLRLIDWEPFAETFEIIDRGGGWQLDGKLDGTATLTGRGSRITLEHVPEPLPDYLLEQAFARSFWFPDGDPRLRAREHTAQLVMRCELDTRAVPYEDVRQTAKVATLLLGLVAKHGDVSGLYHAGIETIVDGPTVVRLTGILHDDEIPIQMWTWTAPHSLQADAVSLSTGGLAPFLGYEVEVWNAPGDRDFVAGKLNSALRYLLINGPVVRHGDTMGEEAGDRSLRCFFGDSKADRDKPVKAMLLEFSGPEAGAPRPDVGPAEPAPAPRPAPPQAPTPTTAPPGFGRRAAGGFGRKGL